MQPNYSNETLDRIKKLDRIKALGVNPFAIRFDTTHQIGELLKEHKSSLAEGETSPFKDSEEVVKNPTTNIRLAGRVMLHRSFGKICFATISDGTGRIQVLFSRENCEINVGGRTSPNLPISSQIGSSLDENQANEQVV